MNGCVYRTQDNKCEFYSDYGKGIVSYCDFDDCEDKEASNADRIRAMSDEELAEWIADILNHCENKKPAELCRMSCPLYKCCNYQPSDNIEDWLKAPMEVGK